MFKNHFKIAYRFLLKNKIFSFINIIGLAIGTLCCLYILLYVSEEYSYDKHHKDAKDIYRITSLLKTAGDKHDSMATCSPPIAPAMKNDFSEVIQFTRVVGTIGVDQHLLRYQDKSFYEKEVIFVDSTFFDVFTYHFVYGIPSKSLTDPYSVVLLKPTAEKLFGNADPVGKLIQVDNSYGKHDFKVTGVVDESMGKSHLKANMFITMNSGGIGDMVRSSDSWAGNNFTNSFIKIHPEASATALESKLPAFLNKYGQQQLKDRSMEKVLHLQPVTSIHTTPGYAAGRDKAVSPAFLYILLLIAALIQIIACINFMNLSTARASKRAKEVGVRKVIGAGRGDLVRQFLGESFLLSIIGVLMALPLLWLSLPYLNAITNADIKLSFLTDYRLWLVLAGLILTTGFASGSYPAFYLSAFKTIKVIKGNFTSHISSAGIRRSLVVFQFSLSVMLIIGIIIIYSQLNYIKSKDLGFEKDQQLVFTFHTDDTKAKMQPFVNDLRQLPEVKAVSKANNYPSQFVFNDQPLFLQGGDISTSQGTQFMMTDEYFTKALGLNLISGREFRQGDSGKVIINEALTKKLGIDPMNATGIKLYTQSNGNGPAQFFEVAGVMKDFNYLSLHEAVKPFMIKYNADNRALSHVIVSTGSKNYKALLGKVQSVWHANFPEVPLEYVFLDDEVQKQYEADITIARIINSFAVMAVLISCLGLFGLSAFNAEQRKKEVSIRKILGANVFGLTTLLSRDFLKLVLVAIVIATPVAYWAMDNWLQAFVYRVPITWWMIAIAALLAILIALFTVSFQAIKAAMSNPVRSLRAE